YRIDARRLEVLQTIKAITGKNWGPYTTGRSKPSGVVEIENTLTTLKTTRKGVQEQLAAVKGLADTSHKTDSPRRSDATKDLYKKTAEMKFQSDEDLTATTEAFKAFNAKWFA